MNIKTSEVSQVGMVLGIVLLVIGFNYDNNALLMIGSLVLLLGLFFRFKKEPKKATNFETVKRPVKIKL